MLDPTIQTRLAAGLAALDASAAGRSPSTTLSAILADQATPDGCAEGLAAAAFKLQSLAPHLPPEAQPHASAILDAISAAFASGYGPRFHNE